MQVQIQKLLPLRDRVLCKLLELRDKTPLWTPKPYSTSTTLRELEVVRVGDDVKCVSPGDVVFISDNRLREFYKAYHVGDETFHLVHEQDLDGVVDEDGNH